MIQVQLKDGTALVLGPDIRIPVGVNEQGETEYVGLEAVERIVWAEFDYGVGEISLPNRTLGTMVPGRALFVSDPHSGIQVYFPMTVEGATEVGNDLAQKKVVLADASVLKQLPRLDD